MELRERERVNQLSRAWWQSGAARRTVAAGLRPGESHVERCSITLTTPSTASTTMATGTPPRVLRRRRKRADLLTGRKDLLLLFTRFKGFDDTKRLFDL